MTSKEKEKIKSLLGEYCEQKGSQNKGARALVDVSPATVSQVLSGKWDLISDDMWRNIASQVGYDRREWRVVETRGYRRLYGLLTDAQDNSLVLGIIGDAGTGKTEAIRCYAAANRDVYHLCCSEYWNKKHFVAELLRCLGMDATGTIGEMIYDAVQALKKKSTPMIILDEADKLSDQVLYFFISLYNQLEDHCGIILIATDYLKKRINAGVRNSRKGYREIYSRIGRKFISLPIANSTDVTAICEANGVSGKSDIKRIIDDSECDLRRVKRLVYAAQMDSEYGNSNQ